MPLTPESVYAILKKYVKDTAIGFGAVKGAPATIKSIKKDGKKNTVQFEWTGMDGSKRTSDMIVMDGEDGKVDDAKLTYTNTTGAYQAVGGVPKGQKFNNTPIQDVLDMLFSAPYTKPSISIGLSCNNLYSANDLTALPQQVTVTASVTKHTDDITKVVCKVNGTILITKTDGVANGGTFQFVCPKITGDTTYTVEAFDGTNVVSAQAKVTVIGTSYLGYIESTESIDDVDPHSQNKLLGVSREVTKVSRSYSFTTEFPDDGDYYVRIYYMYPKSLGALTSITDNMGMPNLDEYEMFERTFDNIVYYVYISPATGSSGLIQNYS